MSARADEPPRGFAPGGVLAGTVAVPGSKSLAQRAIVAAGLAGGTTRIAGLPDGEDVARALALVAACGARVDRLAPAAVAITGSPPGPHRGWRAQTPLELGESGTLARLATAAVAFCARAGDPVDLVASGSLLRRASPALFAALRAAGVALAPLEGHRERVASRDGWPARVHPIGPPSDVAIERPGSSQEVSALLVALAAYPGPARVLVRGAIPSRPYLAMTIEALGDFGVAVETGRVEDGETFALAGPLRAPATPVAIEPDASSAAVAACAAVVGGGSIRVVGLSARSRQGDVRIVEHLARFGARASIGERGLEAAGAPTRGADIELSGEPDLAPVLAIVAARAALDHRATSRLGGLATLRGKESARAEVLARGLSAVGFEARAGEDDLAIGPPAGPPRGALLDPESDHRMAFAFALLGLLVEGVLVRDPGCVAKSWPGFWRELERAGARPLV